jgi:hypothetical protein
MESQKSIELSMEWGSIARQMLLGRKIVGVRYLLDEEMESLGWDERCVVLILDNGNMLYPSSDDEGNRAGALFTTDPKNPVLPVLWS